MTSYRRSRCAHPARGAVVLVCLLQCPAALTWAAGAGDALTQFVAAMARRDDAAMRRVVRHHRRDMTIAFFSLLNESASFLEQSSTEPDAAIKARVGLLLASKVANAFSTEYIADNVLCAQIRGSESLLTARARRHMASDLRLALFLADCAVKGALASERAATAADLKSIIDAVTEKPEARAKRLLEAQLARLRKERAVVEERLRLARFRARVAGLRRAADVQALVALLGDPSQDVRLRAMAAEALGELRASAALDHLIRHAEQEELQGAAIEALRKIRDERAVPVLLAKLEDATVGGKAAAALGEIGGDAAARGLHDFLATHRDIQGARLVAIRASLSQIADRFRKKVDALAQERDVDGLLSLLADRAGIPDQQTGIIKALGALGDARAVDGLVKHADTKPLVPAVIAALVQIGGERSGRALVGLLGHSSAGGAAADALATTWGGAAAAGLGGLLRGGDLNVAQRRAVILALGRLGKPEAVATLIEHADDDALEDVVVEALGQIGGERAASVLVRKLDDPSAGGPAAKALAQCGSAAMAPLVEKLNDAPLSTGTRRAAAALVGLGYRPQTAAQKARLLLAQGKATDLVKVGPSALPTIASALTCGDAEMRRTARAALGRCAAMVVPVLLVAFVVVRRRWIFPTVKVAIAPGQCRHLQGKLHALPYDTRAEAGTILRTMWARSRLGLRRRIKVEVFVSVQASSGAADEDEGGWRPGRGGLSSSGLDDERRRRPAGWLRRAWRRITLRAQEGEHDVLVSAGASVRPGTYLARGPDGSVRVRVKRARGLDVDLDG